MRKEYLARTPLLSAMQSYLAEGVLPFHTPGHKLGKGAPESLRHILGPVALSLDLTFIPGLGDLFEKQGPIRESEKKAAALYGADSSYFLINGTTGGIYAMILATVGPGEKIIIPRNIHRSVMGGLILSGATPLFVRPEVDADLQIAMNVTAEAYEASILANPDAKAVLLLNPTYYGVTADIARITTFAHNHGMLVLVDEAHGPHFLFSSALPLQGLTCGADIVVQSTHKILGALSQGSLLHCKQGRVSIPRLEMMLQLSQSSSANYLLLASLEAAVAQMAEAGPELVGRAVELAGDARIRINRIPGLYCFGRDRVGRSGIFGLDATKLTVTVRELGMRGNEAESWLRRVGKVQAELSDANNLLFLITLGDDEASVDHLVAALADLAAEYAGRRSKMAEPFPAMPEVAPPALMSPREAVFSQQERMDFHQSAGRVCAEMITSYPPGIPILFPGEQITRSAIEYCQALQKQGFTLLGPEDPLVRTVGVVA